MEFLSRRKLGLSITQCLGTFMRMMAGSMLLALDLRKTKRRRRSAKVLHLPPKSTHPIAKQTYPREPAALFRQSMILNASCVKRVLRCHVANYSEVKRWMNESRLCVVEDCATTVLPLDTWQCSALRKATARLLYVK